jgi:hypothetical protein
VSSFLYKEEEEPIRIECVGGAGYLQSDNKKRKKGQKLGKN